MRLEAKEHTTIPSFAVSHNDRGAQEELQKALDACTTSAAAEEYPTFYVFTNMQEHVSAVESSLESENAASRTVTSNEPPQRKAVETKCALLWSHHLLAMSKRKDIQHWSVELKLWSLAKIGYPGVIVVEGVRSEVDEFLRRVKALQWYALQVRYEESSLHEEVDESVVLRGCALRKAVEANGPSSNSDKPHGYETNEMSELASIMRMAGLGEIFATSMKLPS